jgi:hypothetical protein
MPNHHVARLLLASVIFTAQSISAVLQSRLTYWGISHYLAAILRALQDARATALVVTAQKAAIRRPKVAPRMMV